MDLLDDDGLLRVRRGRTAKDRRTDPEDLVRELGATRTQTPTSNVDLETFQMPTGTPAAPATDACHLCGHPQKVVCAGCGHPVCSAHAWVMLGLCRDCATDDRMRQSKEGSGLHGSDWL